MNWFLYYRNPYYVEGLPVREIAGILGVPSGTVKSRLYHAREQMRAIMEVQDGTK